MTPWSVVLIHDGDPVLHAPVHPGDVASIAAEPLAAMFGGPVSVGGVLWWLRQQEREADDEQLALEVGA